MQRSSLLKKKCYWALNFITWKTIKSELWKPLLLLCQDCTFVAFFLTLLITLHHDRIHFFPKKSSLEVNMFFEDYPFLSRTRTQKENESVYNWIEVQIHSLSKKSESLHLKNWIEANLINEKGKAFIYHSHRSAF